MEAGGLYVIGTERHESRRIDNQLRGRAGRQGDPGASKFFLSLQDDLMRIFGSERMDSILQRLGLEKGEAIAHPWVNKALEKAQQKVEARNFELRKNILKYDNVLNDQRKVVFEQRREIMSADDVSDQIADMRREVVESWCTATFRKRPMPNNGTRPGWKARSKKPSALHLAVVDWTKEEGIAEEEVHERILKAVELRAAERAANAGIDVMRYVEKAILLQTLDTDWREHIVNLDHLRQYVGLRGYGQRDPLNEYKSEAFALFEALLNKMRRGVVRHLMHLQINVEQPPPVIERKPLVRCRPHHINPLTGEDEGSRGQRRGWDAAHHAAAGRRRSIRTIPTPGARSSAMPPAPAARAANSSTATARWCSAARVRRAKRKPGHHRDIEAQSPGTRVLALRAPLWVNTSARQPKSTLL